VGDIKNVNHPFIGLLIRFSRGQKVGDAQLGFSESGLR
jgi:hypothetical protein